MTHDTIDANCRRRISSGAKDGARPGGTVMSSSGDVCAAEALAAGFCDRMQRRVLQQLRGAPLDPGVWSSGQPRVELFDEP
jgi:hypothetical protein